MLILLITYTLVSHAGRGEDSYAGTAGTRTDDSKYTVLLLQTPGTKGTAEVYDKNSELIYRYTANEDYLVSAEVSGDNEYLAVLCIGSDGSALKIYSLDETEPYSRTTLDFTAFDIMWLSENRIMVLGENMAAAVSKSGKIKGSFCFDEKKLCMYCKAGDCAVLQLCDNFSGGKSELVSLNSKASVVGRAQFDFIDDLYAKDNGVAVESGGNTYIFSSRLEK